MLATMAMGPLGTQDSSPSTKRDADGAFFNAPMSIPTKFGGARSQARTGSPRGPQIRGESLEAQGTYSIKPRTATNRKGEGCAHRDEPRG